MDAVENDERADFIGETRARRLAARDEIQ